MKTRPAVAAQIRHEPIPGDFLGESAGTMKIVGDITQPIEEPEAWDAPDDFPG
jgi:hypothetical protein